MVRKLKTTAEKEQELVKTISEAKKRLEKLQQQQKLEIGALACKHGLNQITPALLDDAFKKLSQQLTNAH